MSLNPVAFVFVDGMGASAFPFLPTLRQAFEARLCLRFLISAALPTWSLPNYATVIVGQNPSEHGILSNFDRRPLVRGHLFDKINEEGGSVAVSGYYWWDILAGQSISHAKWYEREDTEDLWVFEQAWSMANNHHPDLLLIHPMGVDMAGHIHGGRSPEYAARVLEIDHHLNTFLTRWLTKFPTGSVLVGGDHGMGPFGHGGSTPEEVEVYYYLFGSREIFFEPSQQRHIRRMLEQLLGISEDLPTGTD